MKRPRIRLTIAGLMAIVLFVGVGFAALRNADAFWASVTFTLALIAVSGAVVGAIVRKGAVRSTRVGFAVFGSAYLLVDLLPPRPVGGLGAGPIPWPSPLIEWATARLQPYVHPFAPMSTDWLPYDQVAHSLGVILFGLVGAILGRLVAVKDEDAHQSAPPDDPPP